MMRYRLPATRCRLWPLLLLWLCLAGQSLTAQPADDGAAAPEAGQNARQGAAQGEDPVIDQPGGLQAADGDAGDEDNGGDEEDGGAGRFIPSEQISQDLGVSFPADI